MDQDGATAGDVLRRVAPSVFQLHLLQKLVLGAEFVTCHGLPGGRRFNLLLPTASIVLENRQAQIADEASVQSRLERGHVPRPASLPSPEQILRGLAPLRARTPLLRLVWPRRLRARC